MNDRVILDLCGGSGAWSRPYTEKGYDVHVLTMPGFDIRLLELPALRVWGILAAPPCTYFSRMRMCRGKPPKEKWIEGLSVVDACLRLVLLTEPVWWALENPQGWLKKWLGEPELKFDPCDYGDPWTKRTWLWGAFTMPKRKPVKALGPWIHRKKGSRGVAKSDRENPITAPGFARAFCDANP